MKKRILSMVMALVMFLAIVPVASVGAADGDFVISEKGVLTKYNGTSVDVIIPVGVTSIGDSAFKR